MKSRADNLRAIIFSAIIAAAPAGCGEDDNASPPPPDRDHDGVVDAEDPWPDDRCCRSDMDSDGTCDGRDNDRDGDGYDDFLELRNGFSDEDPESHPAFPADLESRCAEAQPDADTDEDGFKDAEECEAGSDPLDPRRVPGLDTRIPDRCDFAAPGAQGPFWLKGDIHMHTTYSTDIRGGDDLATSIRIASWYGDPAMVELHPEYEGRGLDFLAITDHRTMGASFDPAFFSNRMLLIQAEEFGSDAHANPLGISTFIDNEPGAGRAPAGQVSYAVSLAHAQGGVWSVNHPMLKGDPWFWDVNGYDSCEVWNFAWGIPLEMVTQEELDRMEAERGAVSPVIRTALAWTRGERTGMHARFWEAGLTAGLHPAPVGGSDRHLITMPGSPVTWVLADTFTVTGILDGIRRRHTSVSRSPAGPRIEMSVSGASGKSLLAGDEGSLEDFSEAEVDLRVTRAARGKVEIVEGAVLDSPGAEELAAAPEPRVSAVLEIGNTDEAALTWTWKPQGPSWLYARVLEHIDMDAFDEKTRGQVENLYATLEKGVGGPEDLATVMMPFIDRDLLLKASEDSCKPEETPPSRLECVPVDTKPLGTFFVREELSRVINVVMKDGKVTDYAMGALGSAVVVK